ncbi:leucine-rich repeat domain-containing protein [Wukongibacter baidiensis]|uniref:leucine-rich repeat domain-containing protein n=1 Tax=Wukongibacter baidiensis TaxID=1723361 RepID=UPI003D7FAC70
MKKRYSILLTALLIMFSSISSYATVEFPTKIDIPLNKDWTIEFNMNIDESTINEENIYIIDSKSNKHDCELPLPDLLDYNFIQIVPRSNYNSGEKYTLHIKGVKSTSGKGLKDEITMNFNTINNLDEVINFTDANLESVIRRKIGKPTGDIYKSEIESILNINAEQEGISNLEGIQYFTNLQRIYLGNNEISDISLLRDLTNIEYLYLHKNKITNLSSLKGLTNLKSLDLYENKISDISSLENLKNLNILCLEDNFIKDISMLKNLKNLKKLYLSANPISDFTPITEYYDDLEDKDFQLKKTNLDNLVNHLADYYEVKRFEYTTRKGMYGYRLECTKSFELPWNSVTYYYIGSETSKDDISKDTLGSVLDMNLTSQSREIEADTDEYLLGLDGASSGKYVYYRIVNFRKSMTDGELFDENYLEKAKEISEWIPDGRLE